MPKPPPDAAPPILIADDDLNFCLQLSHFLEQIGHRCVTAQDADQCVTVAHRERPKLIILDMQMPGGGAPEAVKFLSAPRFADVPIVFASGMPVAQMKKWFPEAPKRRYLKKPFKLPELKKLVDELLA